MGGRGRFYVFYLAGSFRYFRSLRGPPFWIARKRGKSNQGGCGPRWIPLGLMLTGFDESARRVFALVPRPNFNQGRRWRLSPPLRAYCAAPKDRNTSATTRLQSLQNTGYSLSANVFAAVRAVQLSPVEAVLAIALAIAKRRQTPTARHRTGLNRVNCTWANS